HAWWNAYHGAVPEPYLDLISAESDASRITYFHPIFVPGLLQTRDYAAAITPTTTLKTTSADGLAALVDVRMRRQREVLHAPDPVRLTAVVDESVLKRRVGTDSIMREQLDHLVRLAGEGTNTFAVVPLNAGPHPGLLGQFMIIEYDDDRVDDVLCFEGPAGNVVVRNPPML